MYWYHGTTMARKELILEGDFQPQEGTYGVGVYLSSSKDGANCFGDHILKVKVKEDNLRYVDSRDVGEEFYVEGAGAKDPAIVVCYPTGEKELCIYDLSIIEEIQY